MLVSLESTKSPLEILRNNARRFAGEITAADQFALDVLNEAVRFLGGSRFGRSNILADRRLRVHLCRSQRQRGKRVAIRLHIQIRIPVSTHGSAIIGANFPPRIGASAVLPVVECRPNRQPRAGSANGPWDELDVSITARRRRLLNVTFVGDLHWTAPDWRLPRGSSRNGAYDIGHAGRCRRRRSPGPDCRSRSCAAGKGLPVGPRSISPSEDAGADRRQRRQARDRIHVDR